MPEQLKPVDHSALRVNQTSIIVLLVLAFVLGAVWLVAFVSAVMLIGTLVGQPGFKWLYVGWLKPRGIVKPNVMMDNSQPHRFAQGMGGIVLLLAFVAFAFGNPLIGWTLSWLVVGLAALSVFVGFCVGCFVYYALARFRVPGFGARALPNTIPGMRPQGRHSD